MINMLRAEFIFFLLLALLACKGQEVQKETSHEKVEQIIGTQAIGGAYHFRPTVPFVVEEAQRILDMGSNMIKISYKWDSSKGDPAFDAIMAMPFDTFFFWWRSDSKNWANGLSEADKNQEYKATYEFAKKMLLDNAKLKRTFYLGHWEGDWYLVPRKINDPDEYDVAAHAAPERILGMIDWLNIRQRAVEDARNEVGSKTLSKIYTYTEVNRVRDAMVKNLDRLVNKVLPHTNVDYVSYSAYDVQRENLDTINKTLKYIEEKLPKKAEISGRRVFIGECGIQAKAVGFNPQKHEEVNREIFIKFLKSGVPYILYWEMYNNEIDKKTGEQEGFWLINNKDQKQPLYYTLEELYKAQKSFTNIRQQSIEWLEARK